MLRTITSDSPLLRNWRFYGYLPNLDYITMELSMEVRSKKIGHILNADKISEKKGHLLQNIIFNDISLYKWFYKSVI